MTIIVNNNVSCVLVDEKSKGLSVTIEMNCCTFGSAGTLTLKGGFKKCRLPTFHNNCTQRIKKDRIIILIIEIIGKTECWSFSCSARTFSFILKRQWS